MEILEAAGLVVAAFLAGAINAVAGGGSLVSFPAIIAAGYDAKAANVTNTVALWPGYAAGSYGYRDELRVQRRRVVVLSIPSIVGSIAGSALLLATPVAARMMAVGERSGDMGQMFTQIARFHDDEVARFIDWFTRAFEPLLMAVLGVSVGLVVVLMYMPIFELAGSIR